MEAILEQRLNQDCHCISLEKNKLHKLLASHFDNAAFPKQLLDEQRQLFASSPVFLSASHVEEMQQLIDAIERVVSQANYQQHVESYLPDIAKKHFGPDGVFSSYDFHLGEGSPKLIEINTNAGGVLLNAFLSTAQHACCETVATYFKLQGDITSIEQEIIYMFRQEFRLQFPHRELSSIAIIDSHPESQFLYPEFQLFQSLFKRHGIYTIIVDPVQLSIKENQLYAGETKIDLVYNRLTDFYFEARENQILKQAYENSLVSLTPNPYTYGYYADKRNLPVLTNQALLENWSIDKNTIDTLKRLIPETLEVTPEQADILWKERKSFFFKPINGYGSRGAYRGAKLSKKVWEHIIQGNYIAQKLVPPSERILEVNGEKHAFKMDIRCISYQGRIQQLSARLYQGQTTNLRTTEGGLATVFIIPDTADKSCCYKRYQDTAIQ